MLHAAVGELLLELVAGVLDALARGLDVVDGDADVAEAAVRLLVAVVDGVILVSFSAVVMRQLDNALAVERAIAVRRRRRPVVGEEVQIEFRLGERQLLDQAQAEELVEFDFWRSLPLADSPQATEEIDTRSGFDLRRGTYQTPLGPSLSTCHAPSALASQLSPATAGGSGIYIE